MEILINLDKVLISQVLVNVVIQRIDTSTYQQSASNVGITDT